MMENDEALWELEFIKCQSKKALKNYINKYKCIPTNPYVKQAEEQLRKLYSSNTNITKDELNINHDIISIFRSKGLYASIGILAGIVAVIFIVPSIKQGILDNYHKQQHERFEAQLNARQRVIEENNARFDKWLSEYKEQCSKIGAKEASTPKTQADYPTGQILNEPSYPSNSGYENSHMEYNYNPTSPSDDRWSSFYRESYNRMASLAEDSYKSLTSLGGMWEQNGTQHGVTGRDDVWIGQQIYYFKKMQHDLRDIRHEAATKGISIQEAPVESYVID